MKQLSVTIYEEIADAHESGKLKGELDRLVKAAYLGASVALREAAGDLGREHTRMRLECKIH